MQDLIRRSSRPLLVALISLLVPSAAYAQAAITGVVKDASGGVLPGATVEAASPVLIEKVRTVITDAGGQYRIVDLRPGTYAVTFSVQGFTTVKREGIELSGNFVATVNADMKVGSLEETVTVTGESPTVDVQSTRAQSIIDKDILAAIPSSRNVVGIQAIIPGMQQGGTNMDSGGINGTMQGGAAAIHGGRVMDSRIYADGINMGWAGSNGGGGQMPQVAAAQEVVMTISGGLGEAETSGVVFNAVPREGSNRFTGQFNYSGSNGDLQSSNYTQALQDAGLRAPFELISVYDVSGMYGGRIVRDKLWFYGVYRQLGGSRTVPGMFYNKNAGNPNSWVVDFDKSKQAFNNSLERQGTLTLTWQATPRNKFNFHWSEQYNDANYGDGGGASVPPTTPEASSRVLYIPSRQPRATWQSPISGKLLAEAGWGLYQARYRFGHRNDGTDSKSMIQRLEQIGEPGCVGADCIAGLLSRLPRAPGQGGFTHSLIGNLASLRAALTYATGAHNMKFGYQGGFGNPSQTYQNYTQVVQIRTARGIPNQLTQTLSVGPDTKYIRNLIPTNFYAQDQWTHARFTLQGGVRYDSLISNYPDQRIGGPGWPYAPEEIFFPSRSTPGYSWKDITPRVGVAYDLFGNGKTAVKFNMGKYLEAITASNNDLDMNPIIRIATTSTRGYDDFFYGPGDPRSGNFKPDCDLMSAAANGECARLDNQNLGKPVFTRNFDPNYVGGWGNRPNNWSMGVGVQHEIVPRVSATVTYNRNWWGNWYVVDNRSTALADYTPFSIQAPRDPRLPNGGGYTVSGLYNLVPEKLGQVDELAQSYKNFGDQKENWQGIDVSVVARMRNGLTVQGGTSTGRRFADGCAVRAKLPELGSGPTGLTNSSVTANVTALGGGAFALSVNNPYCRIAEPYRTDFRGLATYIVPKADVQLSATWASIPGDSLRADYTLTAADQAAIAAQIGRPLTGAFNQVNLIAPATMWGARTNNVDMRIAKILRYGGTRTQVGVDIFNLLNTDTVTNYNFGFVPQTPANPTGAWLTPTAIIPARYARFAVQVDF
ncbi:MAG TPA: carboxypeptidase regulatory-like domain-containing protein [Vicinamibacterales bacterium]|nr:carboxypeptidase regulatory-like domain-containing protein [Vicinamibacterales bacterium]